MWKAVLSRAILSFRNDLSGSDSYLSSICAAFILPYTQLGHCNRLNYQSTQTHTCVVMEKPVFTCRLATHCSLWPFNILFFICCMNKWHWLICLRKTEFFILFLPLKWDHGQNLSCDFTCGPSMITLVSLARLKSILVDILLYMWMLPLRQSNEKWLKIRNYLPMGSVSHVYHSQFSPCLLASTSQQHPEVERSSSGAVFTLSAMVAMYLSSTYISAPRAKRAEGPISYNYNLRFCSAYVSNQKLVWPTAWI